MARFKCPRCATILEADDPSRLVCPNCGFPEERAATPSTNPASASAPTYASAPAPTYGSTAQFPTMQPQQPMPPQQRRTSGKAIASLVLGIIGLTPALGWILSPLAIYFALAARKEIRADPNQVGGNGLATAGLVLGIIGLVFVILAILLFSLIAPVTRQVGTG